MKASHSCSFDPNLFQKVKGAVTMQQVAEHYGLKVNQKGLCLCPFHADKKPSLKIYQNGKGFYCFTCGIGGDLIKFAALYRNTNNTGAARELAAAFNVPIEEPVTYRERREAELAMRRQRDIAAFNKRTVMYISFYRILLCEAIHERNEHFEEALMNLTYIEYLLDEVRNNPESTYCDVGVVRKVGEIEGRIANWHIRIGDDGAVSR